LDVTAHSVRPRRRLRSATVKLGAVAVLALSLTACDVVADDDDDDDDDYCSLGTGDRVVAVAPLHVAVVSERVAVPTAPDAEALPARGGFGTHLAYGCGG
jgi:hypothetical protein